MMPMISKRLSVRGWPSGTPADELDTLEFAMTTGVDTRIEKYVRQPSLCFPFI